MRDGGLLPGFFVFLGLLIFEILLLLWYFEKILVVELF